MKDIRIIDMTLKESASRADSTLSFKEKLAVARQLDRLGVACIECPQLADAKTDGLLVRTLATMLKDCELSIPVGLSVESAKEAYAAVSSAKAPRLVVSVPTSAAQMEYLSHVKPAAMLKLIGELTAYCRTLCTRVEFSAEDATRAERSYLISAVRAAVEAGATSVNICDSAGVMLPTEFSALIAELYAEIPALAEIEVTVQCANEMNMAVANSFAAAACGAVGIKTSVGGAVYPRLDAVAQVLRLRGEVMGMTSRLSMTEFKRAMKQLWFADPQAARTSDIRTAAPEEEKPSVSLNAMSTPADVVEAVKAIGYDLSEEDAAKVHEEVIRAAKGRGINENELDAIVATVALAVPPTYKLVDYVINSGNVITPTANIRLERRGEILQGLSSGDGPVDAAFRAVERVTGHHYELDDFQIQSVTEGREAMGNALVRLRSNGKLYSGKGVSTDIIGASIRAYVAALNKIVYEER
ncbi:MAG: hypothetical protein J6S59_04075 [Clostridia bacterium]|nr:hypothetical protein [Clostridia bacterium]